MLQAEKWARRAALSDMVFEDRWGQPAPSISDA
jgi:5,6-dimethylbenzimidazole synthase